jgi:hypothetical protein
VICNATRDLARRVERNQIRENDDQLEARNAQRTSICARSEVQKKRFKNASTTFFSQDENISRNEKRGTREPSPARGVPRA